MTRRPAYILAGGKSRRFGSDKARAELGGQALIVRLARQLDGIASEIVAVADRPDKYADLGLRTIADEQPNQGPLGGLQAALLDCRDQQKSDWILLISCDLTELKPEWIEILWRAADADTKASAFKAEYWHPFPGFYHTELIPLLHEYLASPKASFQRLLSDERASAADGPLPDDWPAVAQVNTREDLQQAQDNVRT